MKILVTGGAGFIGSHVVDTFLQAGHDVAVLDDLSHGRRENIPDGIRLHHMNINDPHLDGVFADEKPEILIHLAAQASVNASIEDPLTDMDSNIKGTVRLCQSAVRHSVKKVLFSSTGGAIYGEHAYYPADERHPLQPLSPYGIGKLAAEKYLLFFNHVKNLPCAILRYSNVYGPRQDPFGEGGVVAVFSRKMLHGEQPIINGTGEQTRDFVYVKDVARANFLAARSTAVGAFNIGTGTETSINTLFEKLNDITGAHAPETHGSALAGEVFRSVLACDKACKHLGWRPQTSLDRGLEETVAYFRNQ